jgi:hypothetical protein
MPPLRASEVGRDADQDQNLRSQISTTLQWVVGDVPGGLGEVINVFQISFERGGAHKCSLAPRVDRVKGRKPIPYPTHLLEFVSILKFMSPNHYRRRVAIITTADDDDEFQIVRFASNSNDATSLGAGLGVAIG